MKSYLGKELLIGLGFNEEEHSYIFEVVGDNKFSGVEDMKNFVHNNMVVRFKELSALAKAARRKR